jgi:hypothetical protein
MVQAWQLPADADCKEFGGQPDAGLLGYARTSPAG